MHVLRRHEALDQQETGFAGGRVSRGIGHQNRVAGKAALDENVPDRGHCSGLYRFEFALQRIRAGIGEHLCHVALERGVAIIDLGAGGPIPAIGRWTITLRPTGKVDPRAAGVVERDVAEAAVTVEPFGAQPHDGIGALLQVARPRIDVDDSGVHVLARLGRAVEQ